jgi:hypothetical protein
MPRSWPSSVTGVVRPELALAGPLPGAEQPPGELLPRVNDEDLTWEVQEDDPALALGKLHGPPDVEEAGEPLDVDVGGRSFALARVPAAVKLSKAVEELLTWGRLGSAHGLIAVIPSDVVVTVKVGIHAETIGANEGWTEKAHARGWAI